MHKIFWSLYYHQISNIERCLNFSQHLKYQIKCIFYFQNCLSKKLFFLLGLSPAVDKVSIETTSGLTSVTSWNKRNVYGFHGSWRVIGYDPVFPIDQSLPLTVSVQTSVQLNSCGPILSAHTHTHCQLLAAQYLASTHIIHKFVRIHYLEELECISQCSI